MHVHMGVLPQREGRHNCSSTHVKWCGRHGQVSQVKSTYKPSGSPAGSLSRFLTRNISTQAPLDGILVHRRVTPSIKFAGTHFGWREALREWSLFPKNTTQCPPPGLESGLGVELTNHEATAHLFFPFNMKSFSTKSSVLMVTLVLFEGHAVP